MTEVLGIDVSKWQGQVLWPLVLNDAAPEVKFVVARASCGRTEDPRFVEYVNGVYGRRVLGAYHFYMGKQNSDAQAEKFLYELDKAGLIAPKTWRMKSKVLPPILDVEHASGAPSAEELLHWLSVVEKETHLCPWIYTCVGWWMGKDGPGKDERFARYPLWVADYTPPIDIPLPWTDWIMHQRTNTGVVNGITTKVDVNVFNGDEETLLWMARW